MNRVIILGNLGKDLEPRYTQEGKCVVTMSVAVKDGENTAWVRVTAWEKVAESCVKALRKGSKVLIDGRLRENTWTTKEGEKRSSLEVVAGSVTFLDGRPKDGTTAHSGQTYQKKQSNQGAAYEPADIRQGLDDIPF